jgi:hypothetical protein
MSKPNTAKAKRVITVEQARYAYSISDWQYEVRNGDTQLGYKDWVLHQLESNGQSLKGKFE